MTGAVKPILFSAPMVKALLDGRKSQTRRVLKPQPQAGFAFLGIYAPHVTAVFEDLSFEARPDHAVRLPYAPGDLLWVRETWSHTGVGIWSIAAARMASMNGGPIYAADGGDGPWWPSIFLPREFSRLTLKATGVRVERVQDISEADAGAEGIRGDLMHYDGRPASRVEGFAELWTSLNARRGFGWADNPWICAVTFEVIKANVDSLRDPCP